MAEENVFLKLIRSPFKFRLFLFSKLPSAYFSGVRVKEADEKKCVVTVPYKWFSQNPFRSTYFACLSMAAEMSTGILAMANTSGRKPPVSMLVVHLEASYFKKATGLTTFVCSEGEEIKRTVEEAAATGESKTYRAKSVGTNEKGEVVAEFYITWSFKAKTPIP
ncbi:MAG: DUF4442 domain-containing protein [Chitinophagaceae bacterium]|nr:DUF4442 domain-containing protein [Chitinophagaceae bacterium]